MATCCAVQSAGVTTEYKELMLKFREHRGGLQESMETVVEVVGRSDLAMHLADVLGRTVTPAALSSSPYGGMDNRIGWDTHLVMLEGFGPVGFTDAPLVSVSASLPE